MSFLALDWGLKKVGVATCDPDGRVITPRAAFQRKSTPQLWSLTATDKAQLLKLKAEFEIERVVIGDPHTKHTPAAILRAFHNFRDKVFTLLAVPVESEDETLSSWEAQRTESVESEDSVAAALILKSYLLRRPKK